MKFLQLERCASLQDISALAECRLLEHLTIPVSATNLACLRSLPNLKRLGFARPDADWRDWKSCPLAAEFWKAYDARQLGKSKKA